MDFVMDLQLFGGGESTTTSREIPDQTANEAALEKYLLQMGSLGGNMAPYAYQAFAGSLNDVFTPNFNSLYNEYVNRTDNNQQAYSDYLNKAMETYQGATDSYSDLMNGALRMYKEDTNNLLGEYHNRMDNYLSDYANRENQYLSELQDKENSAVSDYLGREKSALNQYEGGAAQHLGQYEGAMGSAKSAYDTGVAKRSSAWDDLVNGVLPSQYATNRQAALDADLRGTVGSAVNDLANRGVINSSVGNKALGDISQNAADTLAKMYNTDLNTEASLLGQDRSNVRSDYDVAAGNAGSLYGAQSETDSSLYGNRTGSARSMYGNETDSARSLYGNQANAARSVYGNQVGNANSQFENYNQANQQKYANSSDAYTNEIGQYANMLQSKADNVNSWLNNVNGANQDLYNGAISGQAASLQVPSQYLSYAGTLSQPTENLYNTMYSGRMGTGSTTTTKDDGGAGMFGAIGSLGAAAIMCFTGDTLVTTPDGYKAIRDIEVGDKVLSVNNGEIVPKKVKSLSMPQERPIVNVYFENGTVWHTTAGQRYFDGRHFCYCGECARPALVLNGTPSAIRCTVETDAREVVYDITLEGFAGENVFFANDVAAEGFGE